METDSKITHILGLADKNFKAAILIMPKGISKNKVIIHKLIGTSK